MKTLLAFLALSSLTMAENSPATKDPRTLADLNIIQPTDAGGTFALASWAPTSLNLSCGKGAIIINLKTGQVDLPKGMTLPDAAVAFWLRVAQCFPECQRAILTGDPTPLTTKWFGRVVMAVPAKPRPPDPWAGSYQVLGPDGKPAKIIEPKWDIELDENIELGLRSDGVVVWRKTEK